MSNLEDLRLNEYGECIRVHTDKGTEVATNLVIVCNGIRVNSSAYHSAFGKQEPRPTPGPLLTGRPLRALQASPLGISIALPSSPSSATAQISSEW